MYTNEYILECLNKYCQLTEDNMTEENFYSYVIAPLIREQCFPDFEYDHGISKLVLLFPNCDFVIKIPFYGRTEWVEDGDEEGENEFYETAPFYCADAHSEWDYCEAEMLRYEMAKRSNLDFLFAKTERIGYVQGWPIYKQERAIIYADSDARTIASSNYDQAKQAKNQEMDACWELPTPWLAELIAKYDLETLYRLDEFCADYAISDLHAKNIGFVAERPVLIDYSSYND